MVGVVGAVVVAVVEVGGSGVGIIGVGEFDKCAAVVVVRIVFTDVDVGDVEIR